jgi:hypothetical protein
VVKTWFHLAFVLLVLAYLSLAIAISQKLYFSRALDEGYHLEYITFIKQHGRLPISYEERAQITRADFPPLYHLLVSALSSGITIGDAPRFKYFWDSFRYRAIDHREAEPWSLDTEDLTPPYVGRFLVWQIGRWTSIGLGLLTVIIVFCTLREIPPFSQYIWLPLVGVGLLAFNPRFLFLSASLNDDNLLGPIAAFFFWMLVKIVKDPKFWWPFVGLGVALGLSFTVKYTLVVAPVAVLVICLWQMHRRNSGWRWAVKRLGVVAGLTVLASSWWFAWNLWYLNTVAQDGWVAGLLRPLLTGGNDTTLNRLGGFLSGGQVGLAALPENTNIGTWPALLRTTFESFWAYSISDHLLGSPYVFWLILLLLGLVTWGLIGAWRQGKLGENRLWLTLLGGYFLLFLILPLLRFELTHRLGVAAQGRHILVPAATVSVALMAWGLFVALPARWRLLQLSLVVGAMVGWSSWHLAVLTTTIREPLPMRTSPEAAEWLPNAVNAKFGQAIELITYNLDPQPDQGRLGLELAWRSLAYVNENYRLVVTLLNAEGEAVSHWTGYHGQGRVPTLAWDPGDVVFDRLALPLPDLPAGTYTLQVELVGQAGPLPPNGSERTTFSLAEINLSQTTNLDRPVEIAFVEDGLVSPIESSLALWRADGRVAVADEALLPRYRYPGTITLVAPATIEVELVDPNGQPWSPTQRTGLVSTFVIGPRWVSGVYRASFSWPNESQAAGPLTTGPLLEVDNWWERTFELPEISTPVEANFANQILFLGYKLPNRQVKAGQALPLTLYWQALPERAPQAEFIQFNKLLDQNGQVWGGYDRQPLEYYNTLLWAPGEVVVDGYAVPVDPGAPPGEYYLNVGYYLPLGESAVNLPLVVAGQRTEISSVTIGPIEVLAP